MSILNYKNFEAFAFDFDGLLADSRQAHTTARRQAFSQMAEETGDERYRQIPSILHENAHFHGQSSTEIIGWVLKEAGITKAIDDEVSQEVVDKKKEIYKIKASHGLPAMEGVVRFTNRLAKHVPDNLAIVTTAYRQQEVMPFLRRHRLTDVFPRERIVAREDTTRTKPLPDPYLMLVDNLGIKPIDLCAFEDSAGGIQSANRAGAYVVAVATTHSAVELSQFENDTAPRAIAWSFEELGDMLEV